MPTSAAVTATFGLRPPSPIFVQSQWRVRIIGQEPSEVLRAAFMARRLGHPRSLPSCPGPCRIRSVHVCEYANSTCRCYVTKTIRRLYRKWLSRQCIATATVSRTRWSILAVYLSRGGRTPVKETTAVVNRVREIVTSFSVCGACGGTSSEGGEAPSRRPQASSQSVGPAILDSIRQEGHQCSVWSLHSMLQKL